MLFVAILHCCTSALYCIIVRMRELDTKFLAGILLYVNIFAVRSGLRAVLTYKRIPARNFVSNSRIRTIMQYSAEVQQWRSAANNTQR